ncbi:Nonribosomal peptide synthetase 3 [Pyrenophora teres f. maculata]|nr:Nonribosomal peptide synthetase 3 [Pyrenophora teres f. maculata]
MQNFGRVSLDGDEGSTKTMQEDREAASVYWQSTLAGCQAISFPTLPPAVQQPVAEATTTYQCPPLVKRPSDITISTVVYGAWAIVASYYTNVDDVVFGTTITGRTHVNGVEAMFEPDTDIVPQQEVQLILHEQTGLEQIAKVSADAKRACHFQTLLVLQPASGKRGKETIGERHSQSNLQEFMEFALVVQCVLDTEGIRITASFDPRVLDQWNVDKMLHQFSFVMSQLAGTDEDTKIATIDAVTPEDRQQLWEWNRDIPPTTERCIHDLFTEQARARPTAPAICAWDGEMTYGELDALSSRLAGHLVDLGVKPEVVVPLCFEKSMWTVVAMLAVLKAGGAFLLLDPSLPRERLKLMCRKVSGSLALSSQASALVIDDLIVQWEARVHLRNSYGSSETAGAVSSTMMTSTSTNKDIGRAITGVFWIVDPNDHKRLLPIGAVGEVLIEGPALGREYIDEAEKTAASFIEAPAWRASFGQNKRSNRLYKTGDLARYKKDGSVELIGRKDNQVKLRGQRIELGEIEHQVRQAKSGVKEVVGELIRPRDSVDDLLACFIVLDDNPDIEMDENEENTKYKTNTQKVLQQVQERLDQFLPQYMVPSAFIRVPHLPLTWSGKIDRRKIREMGASFSAQQLAELRTQSQGPKRQPTTAMEQALQQLWAQVLSIDADTIGLDDSFFRLGGDSIAAMKLVAEARKQGIQLTVADVFRSSKLCQLTIVAIISVVDSPTTIPRVDHIGPASQSFAQGRLWFLEELYPGLNWYSIPFMVRMKGPLQLEALNSALLAVESRHETLRTTFGTINGVGSQVVRPFCSKDISIIELPAGDKQRLTDALQRDQATPFNLRLEPGWRATIYRIGEDEHVLSIVMHHIISDGWSLDVLKRELAVLYAAAVRGENLVSQLSPLPVQYRDFSIWQRMPEQMQGYQKQLDYWVAELRSSRPAEFLCDKPRPATLSGKAGTYQLRIDGPLYKRLQRFCRAHEVTSFVVLLAAFRAAHYRLTGQDDATIGAPNANRDRWELRDMIGFFVNMQCIRIKVEEETSFRELVQQVYSTVVASLANQDVPFESIVSTLQRDRDISRNPLAQVAFAVHAQRDLGKFTLDGVETDVIELSTTSRFDLEFHFFPEQSGLQGYIYFSEDLFAPETISCLAFVFESLLDQCLAEPETKIASTRLLTDKAYAQLNQMGLLQVEDKTCSRESSIVDVFCEQVAAWPAKVAVKDTSAEMTYAQVDAQSDRIAQTLAARGLGPETAIGVFATRRCETIVAFLGILKAGLAYMPFDTQAPARRIESILSSFSGQKLVLVGMDVEAPFLRLTDVEFVRIADMLNEATDNSLTRRALEGNSTLRPFATSLAYIIFTSGSTGQPKGVMVEHRGIVRMAQHDRMADFRSTKATAHMANLAFDGSSWEIYTCLLNGGTLVCIDATTVLDQDALLEAFTRHSIRVAFFTPALLKHSLAASPRTIGTLDVLLVAGDRADPGDMFAAQSLVKSKVANAYGPTENSVMSTLYILTEDERCVNGVPIGRAISSSGAYVMDAEQQLVPLGTIGELVVTGDGVARGYTDPKRNTDRFVTVTVGNTTMRAYRTGDYVRQRPTDGQLEFFGRIDGQVKIRGHRIELGEIENVLCSHRCVRDAAVVLAQKDHSTQGLFGYVTLNQEARMTDDQVEDSSQLQHVNAWEERFDSETYAPINSIQPETIGRDFIGWTSMYDGSNIDKAEMNEWLDDTIRAIYAVTNGQPGHILEIGSGTGMVLFNLSNGLQSYVGLDPSEKAVRFITETARCTPLFTNKVRMYKATATDTSRIERPFKADLAVLNSVVQYFPSQEYLFRVVEDLLHVDGMKTLFFGDIRSYALHREFLATRALRIAGNRASKEEIQRMLEDMEQVERELLIDPGFFTSLPSRLPNLVEHVEIQPKRMKATNELSCYRYTAIVHTKYGRTLCKEARRVHESEWLDFEKQRLDRSSLLRRLENLSSAHIIAVSNIPHSKAIFSRCLLGSLNDKAPAQKEWISSVRQQAEQTPCLSATDLVNVAEEAGCCVEISWSRQYSQHGGLDCIFYRRQPGDEASRVLFEFPSDHADRPQHTFSNRPLQQQLIKEVQHQLEETVRLQLPAYMVPQSIHILEKLPINENGKVDRKALAQKTPLQITGTQDAKRQPETQAERTMQQLWARVLSIEPDSIGLDDSFFRLGGDSIAAMKLVSETRRMGQQLSVADIFRHPKLAALVSLHTNQCCIVTEEVPAFSLLGEDADVVQVCEDVAAICSVDVSLIKDVYPCSPLQEGLMSLTAKRAGDYIMQSVLELRADVDEDTFRAAWQHVAWSTAALRTRMVQHSELDLLQVVVAEDIQWIEVKDLEEYLREDKTVSMGLGDPLVRYALVKEPCGGNRWFVWTIHHALYDGWSLPRILHAVQQVYSGGMLEKQPGFNAFIQYLDQQDQEAATLYWQTTLAGCEAVLFPPLPSMVAQPAAETTVEYQCTPLLQSATDITTSTLIRAAWAIVASRYTSSDDVVFGTTVTGRNTPVVDIDKLVGPTIATVPVRVRIQNDQTVSSFLQGLQQQAIEMIAHEQTGLQRIAKMGSGAQHACGFQTLLVVQPAGDMLSSYDMLGEWRSRSELQDFTTYALMVQCTLAAEGVQIMASFDRRVVEQWIVEKMLSQFSFVMLQLAEASANTKVAEIDTTTPADRQQLWAWNQDVPPAIEQCVHELFAEQARARPDEPAICAWDGELTYGELDALSTKLADHLTQLGVKPEDVVPLCFEKSMWTVVAMLAVLKAGGAFVPLDPDHPASRHEDIFRQTGTKVVVASAQYSARWTSSSYHVVTVCKAISIQLPAVEDSTNTLVKPENAAYIIFTSGSTGIPKGVVLGHRAVATSCLGHGRAFGITELSRVLQFASYTFDACIAEIITTLLFGGCICVPSESDRRNNLAKAISTMDINWSFLTPSVARLLDPGLVPSLKILVVGGEQVSSTDWDKWQSSVQFINGYGPTECCVFCVGYSSSKGGFRSGIIGKPVASVGWVVDPEDHNRLAPLGSIGELLVEGPILARGYLNDVDKTAAAFIDNPAWLLEGYRGHAGRRGRLYKTGDLVRYDADGNLVCLGRKDSQVKVRGQRVELGEIEHHVRECLPEARQLAVEVILPSGQKDHAMLAAFVQLGEGTSNALLDKEAGGEDSMAQVVFLAGVEEELAKRLPQHMVPTVFFALLQFPTTTSGKTDRKRLREIGASFTAQQLAEMRTSSQGPKRQPSTEAEQTMQQLWARVINVEPDSIGLDDNFFLLGGDSIAAMKLVGEARNAGLQLSVADIFRHPKLGALASLQTKQCSTAIEEVPAFSLLSPTMKDAIFSAAKPFGCSLPMDNVMDVVPASYVQEFYIKKGVRAPREAFNYFFIDLGTAVDVQVLEASCCALIDHFSILRTHFVYFQDKLFQVVPRHQDLPFSTFEVDGPLAEESQAIHMQDVAQTSPLGLPTSFMLVRTALGTNRLIIRLSHAQYDGQPLHPTTGFHNYLAYIRGRHSLSVQYWRNLLASSHITNITSKLRSEARKDTGPRLVKVERVMRTPQLPAGLTMASLVSSAWAVVLSHISGEEDVVYGLVVAGRNSNLPGITELMGPCLNFVPFRAHPGSTITAAELLRSVQDQYISLGESDSMGFGDIVQHCTDWPGKSEFDSFIQHQNVEEEPEFQFAGETAKLHWMENPFAVPRELTVMSYPRGDNLTIKIFGNTSILTDQCAEKLLAMLCNAIIQLSGNLEISLAACKALLPACT